MKILISNDDGFRANGINFLREELAKKNHVVTIAPNQERSSCGHGITLGEPIRVEKISEDIYSCSGYPADCILIGVGNICKDNKPDLVVSGINHGANLGQDRYYSGTIAAAREAAFRGIPSIAVSLVTQNIKDLEHFETAAEFVAKLVDQNIQELIPKNSVLNINVPNLPAAEIGGFKYTSLGFQNYSEEVIERIDGRGKTYYWVGGTYRGYEQIEGSDCVEVYKGFISVSLQCLAGKEVNCSDTVSNIEALINKF
jgi:5'-nucleotidase